MSSQEYIEIYNGKNIEMADYPDEEKCYGYVLLKQLLNNSDPRVILEDIIWQYIHITSSELGSILKYENGKVQVVTMTSGDKSERRPSIHGIRLRPLQTSELMLKLYRKYPVNGLPFYSTSISTDPRLWNENVDNKPEDTAQFQSISLIPLTEKMFVCLVDGNYTIETISKVISSVDVTNILVERMLSSTKVHVEKIKKGTEDEMIKQQFISAVSHELRTPLNGINGMLSLIPDAGPLNDKQCQYISVLTKCSIELTGILNNILDYSKMMSGTLLIREESVDIRNIIDEVGHINSGLMLEKSITLEKDVPPSVPLLLTDKARLTQILINLVSNSVKYTKSNGKIQILMTCHELTESSWSVGLQVSDTGIGISNENITKIFEPFYQVSDGFRSGTGLGLSIVKMLVEKLGGNITVRSPGLGKGTTFILSFVFKEDMNIDNLSSEDRLMITNKKVLIVDDRQDVRILLIKKLTEWGFTSQAVVSAEEALQLIQINPHFDIVLVDMCMSGMSGIELAQRLRSEYPQLPLIAISSLENIQGGKHYFDYFMTKPLNMPTLLRNMISCVSTKPEKIKSRRSKKKKKKSIKHIKTMIVEDNKSNQFTLQEFLKHINVREKNITICNNGEECVNMINSGFCPDIIFMDILMPIMSGIDATRKIRAMGLQTMIIATSAAVHPSDKSKCHEAGVDGYLCKPISREKLLETMSPLLKK